MLKMTQNHTAPHHEHPHVHKVMIDIFYLKYEI